MRPSIVPPSNPPSDPIPITGGRATQEAPTPLQSFKSGHLNLDTFSPVNQNGSFEFDRVLKSGKVNRKAKSKGAWKSTWKPSLLVLRPNLLSIYKNDDETGIRASITLSDVTAVASVRKQNASNVFGVFSSSKNYHFQGTSPKDVADWIERIGREARVDPHEEANIQSPVPQWQGQQSRDSSESSDLSEGEGNKDRPQSPEGSQWPVGAHKGSRSRASTTQRQVSAIHEYSGNEMMTSYSDFSDAPGNITSAGKQKTHRPSTGQNASPANGMDKNHHTERVIHHGWLYCLKSKGGVKQWKKLWIVLRPRNIAFYKNEQEYSATKIVAMSSVIDAAEIDPISRSKKFCLQLILEEKTYRFCAPDENSLAQWLGSLKSVVAKRVEADRQLNEETASLRVS